MNFYIKNPSEQAKACVIWMHGLGADASDMAGLAEQLQINNLAVRHLFLNASIRPVTLNNGISMRAWYDIRGMKLTDREDKEGIVESADLIRNAIESQIRDGLSLNRIFLAGFSQGGAMALYTALEMPATLGGVIALSAYLPLASECRAELSKDTPIFLARGQYDPIVLPDWTQQTLDWLTLKEYKVTMHSYLMEHAVCAEEIVDLSTWLCSQIKGDDQ